MCRSLFTLALCFLITSQAVGQVIPNCRDINASVDEEGMINFTIRDLVTNVDQGIDTATLELLDQLENRVFGPVRVAVDSVLSISACPYLERDLKAFISNDLGACWSQLTVKKVLGPTIQGRSFDVYCFDTLVDQPLDNGPQIVHSCTVNPITPKHVADWIQQYECDPGVQDTIKVILREWEAYDKDGLRGIGFDTIVVFRLPEITPFNIYCQTRDTVFCGDVDDLLLPFITIPSQPGNVMSTCDTVPLVEVLEDPETGELVFTSLLLDELCEVSTKVEAEPFFLDCHVEYKVDLIFKMQCYGQPQTQCIVSPPAGTLPNAAENIAEGYWECSFWLINLDTLPPDLHCKKPVLFTGPFDGKRWSMNVQGDGWIDTTWLPYQIILAGNDDGQDSLSTDYCIMPANDTVISFAWEYRSLNAGAAYDPFGYTLNGVFYPLTDGDLAGDVGPVNQTGYKIVELRAGDQFCFRQFSDDGMLGRAFTTIKPLTIVSTSPDQCEAHSYIPEVIVKDDWSGVKLVKANVEGGGTYILTYNSKEECYQSHERIKLPHRVDPYKIYFEAQDSCHNTYVDTCYILVKDRIRPTAVVDKGLTVSLSDKKVWVNAEDFDEGSFDNCEVNLLLARRADWYESCIDLCDSIDYICINEHEDTLWRAFLNPDKNLEPVEAHYAEQLWAWKENDWPCTNIIYNAWIYDLVKQATLHCRDHPYELAHDYVAQFLNSCLSDLTEQFLPVPLHPDPYREEEDPNDFKFDQRLIDIYEQLGGGWTDAVPFDCSDACGQVTVEILVMDYWCNWSIAWTPVWVEDKTPAQVVQDVQDAEITCKIYKEERYDVQGYTDLLSVESIIELAKTGDSTAFTALDEIFGGYQKVWKGPYGEYLDSSGNEVETEIPFLDSSCFCRIDSIIPYRHFDEHLGYFWLNDTTYECGYDPVYDTLQQGLVLANCSEYVYCDQEVWCEIDHCGEGYIYRKFKIWQSCPPEFYSSDYIPDSIKQQHIPDTITRRQRIRVYNECSLEKEMFEVPQDVELEACGIIYDQSGNKNVAGAAHPDYTGWLRYRFDDDCRLIGIDYNDKVFRIVGGDGFCYKIIRTWYYMDWCEGEPADPFWWKSNTLEIDSCKQTIFLRDTTPPECTITGPVEDGGQLEVGTCSYDFVATVSFSDTCGIKEVYYQLLDVSDSNDIVTVVKEDGLRPNEDNVLIIALNDLAPSSYKLKVVATDECNNEGECLYFFDIIPVKKPTPICITHLTGKLNPIDRDQNGLADTAMVTFWAAEFDQSSLPACQDTAVTFRLDLVDGIGDDTWEDDGDSLELGCPHLGTNMIRMWVISLPSMTVDFCDVLASIQSDFDGCNERSTEPPNIEIVEKEAGVVIDRPVKKQFDEKFPDIGDIIGKFPAGPRGADILTPSAEQSWVSQNYPNPFHVETQIDVGLSVDGDLQLVIFDLHGQVVYHETRQVERGIHSFSVSSARLPGAGIYYYHVRTGDKVYNGKMLFIH